MEKEQCDRFSFADGCRIVAIKDKDKVMNSKQVCKQLNEFEEENKRMKNVLHRIINEIEVNNIGLEDKIMYSARIFFTKQEYEEIRKIYKGEIE